MEQGGPARASLTQGSPAHPASAEHRRVGRVPRHSPERQLPLHGKEETNPLPAARAHVYSFHKCSLKACHCQAHCSMLRRQCERDHLVLPTLTVWWERQIKRDAA